MDEVDEAAYRAIADEFREIGRWKVSYVVPGGFHQHETPSPGMMATIAIDGLKKAGYQIVKS